MVKLLVYSCFNALDVFIFSLCGRIERGHEPARKDRTGRRIEGLQARKDGRKNPYFTKLKLHFESLGV